MTYAEQDVTATVGRLLTEHGLTGTLDPDQLNLLDQFHAGGVDGLDRTIAPLHLTSNDRVLDVGSGFGGPARRIAQQTGASVHGIDITAEYVVAASDLTRRCGLEHLVTFEHSGIENHHPAESYSAAVTMHVQMNVADKPAWYAAIAERLDDSGQLVVWDICSTVDEPLTYPMPWSIDGSDSHVVTPDELLAAITSAGFRCDEWVDEGAWVDDWFTTTFAGGLPQGPGLPMLLEDGFTRTINIAVAQKAHTITVMRGRFTRLGLDDGRRRFADGSRASRPTR